MFAKSNKIKLFLIKNSNIIFILCVLLLIPFLWSRQNLYNLGGDDSRLYFYTPLSWLKNVALYSWFGYFGSYAPQQISLPFNVFSIVLQRLFPFLNLQKMLYGLILSFGFLMTFLTLRELLNTKEKASYYAAILGGLAYIFSPLIYYTQWVVPLSSILGVAVYPALFFFFLKAVRQKKIKYLIYGSIISLVFSSALSSIPRAFAFLIGMLIFFATYLILFKDQLKLVIKYGGIYISLFILINSLWVLPWVMLFLPPIHSQISSGFSMIGKEGAMFIIDAVASMMNIFDTLLNLLSRGSIYGTNSAQLKIAKYTYGLSPLSIFLPIIIFIPLLFKKRKENLNLKIWFSLAIPTIFLAYCQTVNIGKIGTNLFNLFIRYLPGWVMFRNFNHKFPPAYVFFYSLTLGISLYIISKSTFKKSVKRAVFVTVFLIVILQALPFIKGNVNNLPFYSDVNVTGNVSIPPYYTEAIRAIGESEEGKVLSLPLTFASWSFFKSQESNGMYTGLSPILVFTGRNDFNGIYAFNDGERFIPGLASMVKGAMRNKDYEFLGRLFGFLNLRYIICNSGIYNDENLKKVGKRIIWKYDNFQTKGNIERLVKEISNKRIGEFGPISIYELSNEYYYPTIYSTNKTVFGNMETFAPMMMTKYLEGKQVLLFTEQFEKVQKEIQEIINKLGVSLGYLFSKSRNDSIDRYFYIPQDSEYTIKTKLSPNFVRNRTSDSKNFKLGLPEEFKKWFFKPSEATCNYFISESGILTLSLYLDGDSQDDEYIQMRREGIKVDLEKYPWLDLTYKVEDHKVQTIEVVLGMDFDGNGIADEYIRGIYPKRAATKFNKFNYNALAKVKKHFPDKEHYDLVELELYPHKIWGVDCKSLERRGKYKFYIKDLQFCNYTSEDFFEVTDYALNDNWGEKKEFDKWKVISDLKDYSSRFQNDNLIVTARFKGEVDENITLARSFKNLSLEQFPFIELEYKVDDPLFQNLELIISLDFDKDGTVDKDIFSLLSLDTTFEKFRFDAFKLVEEAFPNEKEYHLLQIKLRLRERKENFLGFTQKREYAWYFKNIRICSTSFVPSTGFAFNRPIFEIDGEKYWFERKFKNKKETENLLFSEKIYLKKGEHFIANLLKERDNFKIEWIVVEPRSSQYLVKEEPKIVFRKVNPTKYEVKVDGAKGPFWLVFSESFHKGWCLYGSQPVVHPVKIRNGAGRPQLVGEIVAESPKLGVKEAKHTMRFAPEDLQYLFKEPLGAQHHLVNGYANGWYIEPDKSGLGENFTLTLYFWPQSLFYLGLGISGITLIGCIGYLARSRRKKN